MAILTCKSFVILGYGGEKQFEPSSSWFPPRFPFKRAGVEKLFQVMRKIRGSGNVLFSTCSQTLHGKRSVSHSSSLPVYLSLALLWVLLPPLKSWARPWTFQDGNLLLMPADTTVDDMCNLAHRIRCAGLPFHFRAGFFRRFCTVAK